MLVIIGGLVILCFMGTFLHMCTEMHVCIYVLRDHMAASMNCGSRHVVYKGRWDAGLCQAAREL